MNSLPPELLSSIVVQAAQCDSTYSSYRSRLQILSALSLVNRTFRQLAQPLLPRKVWFRNENELERFEGIGTNEKVASLRYEQVEKSVCDRSFEGFSFITALRVRNVYRFDIMSLNGHQQLKKLSLEEVSLSLGIDFEHFALPNVEEVSLEAVAILVKDSAARRIAIRFLAPSHFPSLCALGIKSLYCFESIRNGGAWSPVSIDYSFVNQLDCITIDENGYQDWIQSRQIIPGSSLSSSFSVPLLFDVGTTTLPSFPGIPAYTNAHVRLRRRSESTPNRLQIENALFIVQDLLTRSKVLQEVYLNFYSRGGSGGYQLDADLERKLERLEVLAKEKKVEIIWENQGDDWCKCRVSREFWRRCKEKKEKAPENE